VLGEELKRKEKENKKRLGRDNSHDVMNECNVEMNECNVEMNECNVE